MPCPSISVVLPIYNAERYLRQALASLRWQSYADWEAVCVNDGSTDNSLDILYDFAAVDPRFRIIDQPNGGIVAALNRGLAESRAVWIARMDADDVALPDRFERQLAAVRSDPSLLALGGAVLTIDPDDDPLRTLHYPTDHEAIEQALLSGEAPIAHPTVLMRRDAVLEAGAYRSVYEWVEDTDLWLRLARNGRLGNLADPVLRYRLHTSSVCWKRRVEQTDRLRNLLTEAHLDRGLDTPSWPTATKHSRLSDARGKWARQAARAGRPRVAAKWARRLATERPLDWQTWRIAIETAFRVLLATGRSEKSYFLPNWRQWDCHRSEASTKAA